MKGKKTGLKITFIALAALSVLLAAADVVVFGVIGKDFISAAIAGTGAEKGSVESKEKGAQLVKKISEEGTVLLKNENKALPLNIEENNKVNVFGYTAIDNAWVFTGVGSGSCKSDPNDRVGLLGGLEKAGFEYNKDIIEAYKEAIPTKDDWMSMNQNGKIIQPDKSFYTEEMIRDAKQFSDTAIVVLSRNSGENVGEVPNFQRDYLTGEVDNSRSYLQIAKKEEEMLEIVKSNFSKVIVILNTTNNMQCDFLRDENIQAALYCGPTGLNGAEGVANLLKGKTDAVDADGNKVETLLSPSGHLTDTLGADYTSEPAYANYRINKSDSKNFNCGSIVYQEGIYFGYRWYETAYQEGYISNYDDAVIYSFGHGLSYTDFSWKVKESEKITDKITEKTTLKYTVTVTNTGDYPGKDVVQMYYSAPYINGEIEKSAINLADFAKTSTLLPGESQDVTLETSFYDMASYDCYDANKDGHKGYELDKGDYYISFRTDCHNLKETSSQNEFKYTLDETLDIDKDPTTNSDVINRFTGEDAYASVAIDGSDVGINETYLSRANFASTIKTKQSKLPSDISKINKGRLYQTGANNQEEMPVFSKESNLRLITKQDGSSATLAELNSGKDLKYNDKLIDELMSDLNGEKWTLLLDQLSKAEAKSLVECSGFGSNAIESIGKTKTLDFDGPSGFNENTQKIAEDKSSWTSYPAECVIGCTYNEQLANEIGKSVAFEANASKISGWYAPGVNLHRSNYNGRNFENYSEDPIVSGRLAAATIDGAKSGNLYCYLKHFILSEEGDNPKGTETWLTEQTLREQYMKPFEIGVKRGANAIMSSFSRLGCVWSGANYDLLTSILRDEWGFKGSVVTDWSSGDDIMNTQKGVLAGNDLWLNPMTNNGKPLNVNDATQMYCAKNAVKNNLITYLSTYVYSRDYSDDNNPYKVESGIKTASEVSEWWIPTLISIQVVIGLGCIATGLLYFLPKKKKE